MLSAKPNIAASPAHDTTGTFGLKPEEIWRIDGALTRNYPPFIVTGLVRMGRLTRRGRPLTLGLVNLTGKIEGEE